MTIHLEEKRQQGFWQRKRNTGKAAGHNGYWPVLFFALVFLLPFIITPAVATEPTVIITDYTVTPAVLMPGDMGTVTLTIRNTAQSASEKENTGIVSGGTFASTKSTDINVFIENVHLEYFDRVIYLQDGLLDEERMQQEFARKIPDSTSIADE